MGEGSEEVGIDHLIPITFTDVGARCDRHPVLLVEQVDDLRGNELALVHNFNHHRSIWDDVGFEDIQDNGYSFVFGHFVLGPSHCHIGIRGTAYLGWCISNPPYTRVLVGALQFGQASTRHPPCLLVDISCRDIRPKVSEGTISGGHTSGMCQSKCQPTRLTVPGHCDLVLAIGPIHAGTAIYIGPYSGQVI